MMSSVIFDTAFQQGLLYAIAVFGVVITFRLMNFPDLTVDGSFTLGAAVLATLLVSGYSIGVSIICSVTAGFLAGVTTALLTRKFGISKILSGILVMLILYSVNLRIMGKANISLLRTDTLFTPFEALNHIAFLLFIFIFTTVILLCLLYFSATKLGLFLRATGDNEFMVHSQGVNTDWVFILGVGLSNALIALSGGLVAQSQGFADIGMGIGMIITVLAALIIGESFIAIMQSIAKELFKQKTIQQEKVQLPWEVFNEYFAAVSGAFLYFLIIAICLQLGLAPTDLKLATGLLVIIGISLRFQKTASETYQKSRL
jgi:putative ABC transport system permease protein